MAKFFMKSPEKNNVCSTCGEELSGDFRKIILYDHKKKSYVTKKYHFECKAEE